MELFWLVVATVAPALVVSWLACWLVRYKSQAWGLVDQPTLRKDHVAPTPLGGGLAIWLAVVVIFAFASMVAIANPVWLANVPLGSFLAQHQAGVVTKLGQLWFLLGGGTILMLLGLADDIRGVSWKLRLLVEVVVATAIVLGMGLKLTVFLGVPVLTTLLSVLWIVVLVNSFNMLDNMDGLSGGVAFIACTMLAMVLLMSPEPGHEEPQLFVASMMLVLGGGLLGFLKHNWPPAKLFMGDAGSYFVGYWIAIATLLATYTNYRSPTPHAVLAPLCILAIPLYDMASVILIRLREGRSPFQADRRHFSHRLVQLGMTKFQAVVTIYMATIASGLSSLLLHRTDSVGAIIVILCVVAVLTLLANLENFCRSRDGS